MAAHALTIARQIKAQPDSNIIHYAGLSLGAPGWDACPWNSMLFEHLYLLVKDIQAERTNKGIAEVRELVDQIIVECQYLDGYRTFEAATAAFASYVKVNTPHWRKRMEKFFANHPDAHRTAIPGSAPKWN